MRYFDCILLALIACLGLAVLSLGMALESLGERVDVAIVQGGSSIQALKAWDQTRRENLTRYLEVRIDKLAEWTDARDTVQEQKLQAMKEDVDTFLCVASGIADAVVCYTKAGPRLPRDCPAQSSPTQTGQAVQEESQREPRTSARPVVSVTYRNRCWLRR